MYSFYPKHLTEIICTSFKKASKSLKRLFLGIYYMDNGVLPETKPLVFSISSVGI